MSTAGVVRSARPRAKEGRGHVDGAYAAFLRWQRTIFGMGDRRGYSAARTLQKANVDIVVVQETQFLDADFSTHLWTGYDIKTAVAGSASCGGMALLARKRLCKGGECEGRWDQHYLI